MAFEATIIADSISPVGVRLTTVQCKYPRMVLAETNTHRVFTRNASSSRAIPVKTLMKRMIEEPALPAAWGKNQKGMQASEFYTEAEIEELTADWLGLRDLVMEYVDRVFLKKWNLHKQIANRPLEAWMHCYQVITSTEWDNFFALRRHPDAQPEIKAIADAIWDAMQASTPRRIEYGQWHLPYILEEDYATVADMSSEELEALNLLLKISTARAARVSYRTHDGLAPKPDADILLHDGLLSSGHMSPLEHPATPIEDPNKFVGNFRGWKQYRKTIPGEAVFQGGAQ